MSTNDRNRQVVELKRNWLFVKDDPADAMAPGFDDSNWDIVSVPHDWAISGQFDAANDVQRTVIVEEGETKTAVHIGRTGGLPHVGKAWYRRTFAAPNDLAGKRVYIEFDGAMSHSTVYVNGHEAGGRPYGYISFALDITDFINVGRENLLAVRLDNKPFASRWYPGAGIYRNVRLVVVDAVHVKSWGTYITTPVITETSAQVRIRTEVQNQATHEQDVKMLVKVVSPGGECVAELSNEQKISGGQESLFDLTGQIPHPQLWSVESPNLYTAYTEVFVDHQVVDEYQTRFGVRSISFDAKKGFHLNGQFLKLNGVCMHHDLGALGTAVNKRAIERQLEILQSMGCNAIRTSHNPPAVELLDLCDEMGFLVLDEAFDEWRVGKVDNGYHSLFDAWAERDLRDMIRRDRNHPSIIMWSIGNEIRDQNKPEGAETARFLRDIAHQEDPTRPVTAAFNRPMAAIKNGLAANVDIVGWNYEFNKYDEYIAAHPDWIHYGSETESCISSRGEYYFPVEDVRGLARPSLHCSAYEVEAPRIHSSTPEYELAAQERCTELLGQFTWTGFDYLGEPTPYRLEWPSRSSYFGNIDLCGFPKDRYFLYKGVWTNEPTLHLFPHWNWQGHEGEIIPVHCYTSFDAAELFLNGKSLGVRRKARSESDASAGAQGGLGWPYTRFRLMWDVPYEPGTLDVVALDEHGNRLMTEKVVTAGPVAAIELLPDRKIIHADGEDLSFITVRMCDKNGNFCPTAENRVMFKVKGPATIAATDNGDPTSLEPFVSDNRRMFNGLGLVVLRSKPQEPGEVILEAFAQGIESAAAAIRTM